MEMQAKLGKGTPNQPWIFSAGGHNGSFPIKTTNNQGNSSHTLRKGSLKSGALNGEKGKKKKDVQGSRFNVLVEMDQEDITPAGKDNNTYISGTSKPNAERTLEAQLTNTEPNARTESTHRTKPTYEPHMGFTKDRPSSQSKEKKKVGS